jgi:hypothetical protein
MKSNKKTLPILLGVAIVVVLSTIFLVVSYFMSLRSVYFDLSDDVKSATIYHEGVDGKPVGKEATLASDGSVTLKEGKYIVEVSGDNIVTDRYISFVVDSDTSLVEIVPSLSKEYLKNLSTGSVAEDFRSVDIEEIENRIVEYQGLSTDFAKIAKGELIYDGNWYVGIITTTTEKSRSKYDQYKIILSNIDGEWFVAANQAFSFRYDDFPEIPKPVIQFANKYEV